MSPGRRRPGGPAPATAVWLLVATLVPATSMARSALDSPGCDTFTGAVSQGDSYRSERPTGYVFVLDAAESIGPRGWTIRLFLSDDPERDLVEYATPPFGSQSPRHIHRSNDSSDGETAEWSSREFGFATTAAGHERLADAVAALTYPQDYADQTLVEVRRAWDAVPKGEGRLEILDASSAGTDASAEAGRIERLEFQVELCLPEPESAGS